MKVVTTLLVVALFTGVVAIINGVIPGGIFTVMLFAWLGVVAVDFVDDICDGLFEKK